MIKTLFVYLPFALLLITIGAFVLRCSLRIRAQAIWTMVLLACFSKFLAFRELGGDAFSPELPERVIWIWNWAYSGAVILCGLSLVTLFFRFRFRVVLLPLIAWSMAACGVWNGIKPPQVREVTLAYPDLPPSLDGYRIVQLSDLHISSAARKGRTERIVAAANACTGNVIVITGDIVDGLPRTRLRDVYPLRKLKAADGIYAITGNHEFYYDYEAWSSQYGLWGIRFLSNTCVYPHPGLALGGVDDGAFAESCGGSCTCDTDDAEARIRDVQAAFATATNGSFRVLLQHRPSGAGENAARSGVRLQLSGHTHGGIFPGMAYIVKKFNGNFVRGLYALTSADLPASAVDGENTAYLYVSPGAGQWAGFPIRFFTPTEITVFTLIRAASVKCP